jgi:hypothetical protein
MYSVLQGLSLSCSKDLQILVGRFLQEYYFSIDKIEKDFTLKF